VTAREIRFDELRGDPRTTEGQAIVAGKCISDPIRVGDRFSKLTTTAGAIVPIDLAVLDIELYGTYVLELQPGLAGELVLVGEVGGLPLVGAVLVGDGVDGSGGRLARRWKEPRRTMPRA